MHPFETFDWTDGTPDEHLEIARHAADDDLRALARLYDWQLHPETVLGWVMAQRAVDLGSALTCFFNGEPERFNYLAKRDVPERHLGIARTLDNICLRVNSGFYLALPEMGVDQKKRLQNWLTYQKADRQERRRGRWILDESILDALKPETFKLTPDQGAQAATESADRGVIRRVLRPLSKLATSRSDPEPLTAKD